MCCCFFSADGRELMAISLQIYEFLTVYIFIINVHVWNYVVHGQQHPQHRQASRAGGKFGGMEVAGWAAG